ncbi:MAG: hypothetical protein IKA66_06445 [Candidatus Methanomethylophilaceae archaeon]|nr:hypothetical protein [Candidatus Methanomethylophilaceae archaeon]MBR2348734.1 hypothetical protein [Candidatus Methanomethylophilaceae archaeon]
MSILGIPDFWIWSAYLGCFLTVAFCVAYGVMKGAGRDTEDEEDEC